MAIPSSCSSLPDRADLRALPGVHKKTGRAPRPAETPHVRVRQAATSFGICSPISPYTATPRNAGEPALRRVSTR
jgi:hypothetical protein